MKLATTNGVKKYMHPRRAARIICLIGLFFLTMTALTIVLTMVTVRIHQEILRHRAESLLVDMQWVRLRETSFQDIQPILRRWRRWGEYDGPCTPARCTVDIWLSRFDSPLNKFLYIHERAFDFASHLGEHPTAIHARLMVLNGIVWGEDVHFGIEIREWYPDGKPYIGLVSGEATSVSRVSLTPGSHWRLHPDYVIWWPTK